MKNRILRCAVDLALSFLLGAFILYWIYMDFDFTDFWTALSRDVDWKWMALSLLMGVASHVLRGLRSRLALLPLGFRPRLRTLVDSVFVSYALNLAVPRLGEVARPWIVRRWDGVPFTQNLGTVLAERLLDTAIVLLLTLMAFLAQMPLLTDFLRQTGTRLPSLLGLLQTPWFYVVLLSLGAFLALVWLGMRRLRLAEKVRTTWNSLLEGVTSLSRCTRPWSFSLLTVAIWACYYLHFSLTLNCFDFTEGLPETAALTMFVSGTLAVVVPTPNGAGPWHFVIITLLMLYGVADAQASLLALVVHSVQTLLVILLGLWGAVSLRLAPRRGGVPGS